MSLLNSASLVVTPNGYKEGTLYSVIPNTTLGDMTVVRATTATRVNSAGLIELVPYNLVTYSEQFDNADWVKDFTTITANNIISPDGTQNADRFNLSAGTTQKFVYQNTSQNGTYTQSVYLKKGTHTFVQLALGGDVNPYCNFDLTNGTFSAFGSTATMTDVGNEWYRCTMTYTTSIGVYFIILGSDSLSSARTAATSSTGNFYAWGAQLVVGSSAKDYLRTETRLNIPRLDYSNGTCPSLLVEPQRTNLVTYSQQFDNAAWTKYNCSISANATTSPDGTANADIIVEDSTASTQHRVSISVSSTNSIHTLSVFIKQGSGTRNAYIDIGTTYCYYNFSTGVITVIGGTAIAENYGGGWYRLIMTSSSAVTPSTVYIGLANGNNETYNGNGNSSIAFWGAQLEEGSYPTSYIPTTTASVTRNADEIYKTGISALIGQTEGTIFVEEIYDSSVLNNGGLDDTLISLTDGTSNNLISIFHYGGGIGTVLFFIRLSNVTQVGISSSKPTSGTYKIALAYKNNDVVGYINGVQIGTDTSASIPATSAVVFYDAITTNSATKTVNLNSAILFPTRLTNAELATLTTL